MLPAASVMRRFAVFEPVVVGAKMTPISHPPSGATGVVHPLVPSLKCDALAPVIVAPATVSGATPVLPTTALSSADGALVAWLPNARVVGDTVILGRLEPLSLIERV